MSSDLQQMDLSVLCVDDYETPINFNRLYSVNFRGGVFEPSIRNIFKFTRNASRLAPVITHGDHHCRLPGGRAHAVQRDCLLEIHLGFCQHPILLPVGPLESAWRMRLCGERFSVQSDGCATHSYLNTDANNFLSSAVKRRSYAMPLLLPHEMSGYNDNPENPGISVEIWNEAVRKAQEELAAKVAEIQNARKQAEADAEVEGEQEVGHEVEATPPSHNNAGNNPEEEMGAEVDGAVYFMHMEDWRRYEHERKRRDSVPRAPTKLRRGS